MNLNKEVKQPAKSTTRDREGWWLKEFLIQLSMRVVPADGLTHVIRLTAARKLCVQIVVDAYVPSTVNYCDCDCDGECDEHPWKDKLVKQTKFIDVILRASDLTRNPEDFAVFCERYVIETLNMFD
jgi:hypothetical protein